MVSKDICARKCYNKAECVAWTFSTSPPGWNNQQIPWVQPNSPKTCWLKRTADCTKAHPDFVWGTRLVTLETPCVASSGNETNGSAKRTFTSICVDQPTPSVAYSDDMEYSEEVGSKALTNSYSEVYKSLWFPPTDMMPQLILDLHCVTMVTGVEMVNTKCCSIKSFSIFESHIRARFVRFTLLECHLYRVLQNVWSTL